MKTLVILCGLLFASSAYAGGAGMVAAALPTEEAECRYLLQLDSEANEALSAGRLGQLERLADDRVEAARVIRAKHAAMPECFHQLKGMATDWLN